MEPKKIDESEARRVELAQLRWESALGKAQAAANEAKQLEQIFASEWEAFCARHGEDPKTARLNFTTLELTKVV